MDMVAEEVVPEVSSNGGMGRCKVPCCETMCSGVLGSHEVTFPAGTQRYPTPGVQADESDADEYILMEDCQEEDQKDAQAFVADLAVMKDTVKGLLTNPTKHIIKYSQSITTQSPSCCLVLA
jgi:hypothetical protein